MTNLPATKTLNILLVEDDDGDAKAINRALAKAKIANPVYRAHDGQEAMEILTDSHADIKLPRPALLLVDINMPRMNGIELLREIRQKEELKRTVVFMLTTSDRDEDKIEAYDLNVAGYILKEKAGHDFLRLIELLDTYWRIVELP